MKPSQSQQKAPIILVQERAGIKRICEPVEVGVPLPRGWLPGKSSGVSLYETDSDICLPVQAMVLSVWPDGSAKWLLVSFCVTVEGNGWMRFRLECDKKNAPDPLTHKDRVKVLRSGDAMLAVETGQAVFSINTKTDLFFSSIKLPADNQKTSVTIKLHCLDHKKRPCYLDGVNWIVGTEDGPIYSTLMCQARLWNQKRKKFINISARHRFFFGKSYVKSDFVIHNPKAAVHPGGYWDLGDPGSFGFHELSLAIHFDVPLEKALFQVANDAPVLSASPVDLLIYQDSSGGRHWDSPNHVDSRGTLTVTECGYRYGATQEVLAKTSQKGLRADPWVLAAEQDIWTGVYISEFWQNFPKSLKLARDHILMGFYPQESSQIFELQGGEQKRHEMHLSFSGNREEQQYLLSGLRSPLAVSVEQDSVFRSRAIPWFSLASTDKNTTYLKYVDNCIKGENTFFDRREEIDEFGWRNFGDLYADHEAVGYEGNNIFISHYNNQFDFAHGAIIHFLRSGDQRWRQLAVSLCRHVIDIDIYRTDQDKSSYNNGQFWHTDHYKTAGTSTHRTYSRRMFPHNDGGGGPSNENNYSSGLLYYYYLTGDPLAAKTVLGMADWVISMDDGGTTLFALFDDGPSGLASQTVFPDYHKPGRGPANSINTLLDAFHLTGENRYMQKAEMLIQRCIHPLDDVAALNLDQPEYRWSYLVFLQVLGKYLDMKLELGDQGYGFHYARQSLLHYAEWMAVHERPYLEVLDRVEIPTETWPAHDIRKCHVFHLAALFASPERKKKYIDKADFFFRRCLQDLLSFDTAHLTRPLVILTVYGTVHSYFQQAGHELPVPVPPVQYNFGQPESFIPQRQRFGVVFRKRALTTLREGARILRAQLAGLLR